MMQIQNNRIGVTHFQNNGGYVGAKHLNHRNRVLHNQWYKNASPLHYTVLMKTIPDISLPVKYTAGNNENNTGNVISLYQCAIYNKNDT